MENKRGITLIALVVTIIVLIILAGVSINLVLGDNGIITKAKQAKVTFSQAQAREKLEMVLAELQADKAMDPEYNQGNYINKKIEDNGMEIEEDIVIVNGWQFEIDRNVPEIVNELPKLTEEEKLKPTIISVKTEIKETEIKVLVKLRNENGSKVTYSIKKVGTSEEIEKTEAITDLQYTFTNLRKGEEYIIIVETTNEYGTDSRRIEVAMEKDTVKPQVTILEMKEEGKIEEEVIVTYKLLDDVALDINNCKFFYDLADEKYPIENSIWDSATGLSSEEGTITQSFETEGEYFLHILAVDFSGNYESFVSQSIKISSDRLYLYSLGKVLNEELYGGWTFELWNSVEITYEDEAIHIHGTNTVNCGRLFMNKPINVTGYSGMYVGFETTSPRWQYDVAGVNSGAYYNIEGENVAGELARFDHANFIEAGIYEHWVDLSDLNDDVYLFFEENGYEDLFVKYIYLK